MRAVSFRRFTSTTVLVSLIGKSIKLLITSSTVSFKGSWDIAGPKDNFFLALPVEPTSLSHHPRGLGSSTLTLGEKDTSFFTDEVRSSYKFRFKSDKNL